MQETNTCAARTGSPSGWYDTSFEEMKAFIGMLISTNNSELPPHPPNDSWSNAQVQV